MADLKLKGPLDLKGMMTLKGKVLINGTEALVEVTPSDSQGTAPIVLIPPPPSSPSNTGTDVCVISSFNKTIKAETKPLVTQGMVMQGNPRQWPGMVLPSNANSGPTAVKANGLPINVKGDQAIIFPSGATASLSSSSGQ